MKCNRLILGLTALALSISVIESAQAANGKYRFGFQGTHFLSGLSGMMEFSDQLAFQGIIDINFDAFAFRVLNRFHQETFWNAYAEGTMGFWANSARRTWGRWGDKGIYDQRSNAGFGMGVGIEYDWRNLNASLPPIGWNIALGTNLIPDVALDIGLGVHWKF